ncbi:hypothetical protein ACH4PW_31645 [Streptomyces sp. NPDC017082]|uniref:hypothetical protein n=1 Tax=Streptomyces sp. NPDC017082 TaxID=3364974 RepID=UPI0037A413C7
MSTSATTALSGPDNDEAEETAEEFVFITLPEIISLIYHCDRRTFPSPTFKETG